MASCPWRCAVAHALDSLTFLFPLGPPAALSPPPGAGRSVVCEVVGTARRRKKGEGEGKSVEVRVKGCCVSVSLLRLPSPAVQISQFDITTAPAAGTTSR
jgi:hypothetical protein